MEWEPICTQRLADDLRDAVFDMARSLRAHTFERVSLTGSAGAALLYHYLDRAFPDAGFDGDRDSRLAEAIERLSATALAEGLFDGFSGVGFVLEHLSPTDPDDDANDPNAELDDVIAAALARSPWPGPYDLLSGLVGIGVYALERAPRRTAMDCLNLVVARLFELARPRDGGLAWWTDPRFMGETARELPKGDHNLGVAHGVAGVIALLGRACTLPAIDPRAHELLDGAVRWLLTQRLPSGTGGNFSLRAEESIPARAAWCSGDPGIAAALLLAARCARRREWERVAVELALAAAARAPEQSGVVDGGLCHGAAGLAHLFNRLYQATREERLATAARFWFQHTLDLRPQSQAGTGLLTGVAGVALALAGGLTSIEPDWDRVLLCSIPPTSRAES